MSKHMLPIKKACGKVKWFDDAKGYGFILYEGTDYFVHYKEIKMKGHKTLEKDASVKFIPVTSDKGKPVATEVEVDASL